MNQLNGSDCVNRSLFKKLYREVLIPARLGKSTRSLLLSTVLLVTAAIIPAKATIVWYLENSVSGISTPSTDALSTTKTTQTGFTPTLTLTTGVPVVWYTADKTGSLPNGIFPLKIFTKSPGTATPVLAEILETSDNGTTVTVLGSSQMDINASGGGNHATTYNISVGATTIFTNQRLAVRLTKISGGTATVAFNSNDFASALSSTDFGSTGGGATGAITAKPFYLESKGGPFILSTTQLPSGDGFNGKSLTTALTWTSTTGLTDTVPVGFWNVTIWTNNPGASSVIQVDILQAGISIGHIAYDVNTSGPGNHTTNFSIPVTSAIAFNAQTLGIKISQVSGTVAKVAADGDFPGSLSWSTTTGGTGGGDSGDGTAGPSTDGAPGPVPATTKFTFNNTSTYPNSQVYVMIIGLDPGNTAGGMSWFNAATGKFQVMQLSDNNGIGSTPPYTPPASWGVGAKTYAPYSFTLDQHPNITIPWITSSRIFYSYGYPTYMNVVSTANGVYAAEPANPIPSDPNYYFPWDAIEINFSSGGMNIDTTRVDFFNIPSNYVIASATGATAQRGDLAGLTHSQYVSAFQSYISSKGATTVFGPCVIGGPGGKIVNSGFAAIQAGGAGANYFDAYINSVWAQYPAGGTAFFNLPIQGGPYSGQVNSAGQMVFTKAGDTTDKFYINRKPTTLEIISCAGVFNDTTNSTATTQSSQLAIQAATAATFNRAIAADPSLAIDWTHPGAYYQSAPANFYSAFWHIHGYAGLAYGFPYDDESSQSSDCNYVQPTNITLNMWY